MLIFRNSRSQMFFKIGCFRNIHRETSVLALAGLRLQNTYRSWLSRLSHKFLLGTPLKIRVKRQKQPLKLFCKKGVLRNFANFTGKHLCWSLFLIELQTFKLAALFKRDSNTDFSLILKTRFVLKIFKLLPWLFGHVKALRWLAIKIKLVFYGLILL